MTRTLLPEYGPWVSYEPPPPRPPYRRWWFWTSLVLVAIVVVAISAVRNVRALDAKRAAAWREFHSHSHVVVIDISGRGTAHISYSIWPDAAAGNSTTPPYVQRALPFRLRLPVSGDFQDVFVDAEADRGQAHCRVTLDGRFYRGNGEGGRVGNCDVSADQAIG